MDIEHLNVDINKFFIDIKPNYIYLINGVCIIVKIYADKVVQHFIQTNGKVLSVTRYNKYAMFYDDTDGRILVLDKTNDKSKLLVDKVDLKTFQIGYFGYINKTDLLQNNFHHIKKFQINVKKLS